jgi:acyl carrier protein
MFTEIISKILLVDESEVEGLKRSEVESWDSMTHLILISELEQNFNITFNDEEIASISSVVDIKTALKRHNVSV